MAAVRLRVGSWLRGRRWAALGLVVTVSVVGGGALTLVAGAARTASAVDRYESSRPFMFDADIWQNSGPSRIDELAALPGIDHVEMATFLFGAVQQRGTVEPVDAIAFAGTLGPLGEGLLEGRKPKPGAPGEFVATPSLVEALGATIGDQFDLVTISPQQSSEFGFDLGSHEPDGPVVPATLVGVIDEGVGDLESGFGVALFDRSLLDAGDIGVAASVGVVDLAPGVTVEDLRAKVGGLPDGADFSVTPAEIVSADLRTAVDAQARGVLVLAVVFALAAIVVLTQLLIRQLRPASTERGFLEAIGYARSQARLDPLYKAGVVVVLGSVVAIGLAYAASGIFPIGFAHRLEPTPGARLDVLAHLGGGLVLVVVVLTAVAVTLLLGRDPETATARQSPIVDRIVGSVPSARVATAVRLAFGRGLRAGSTSVSLGGLMLVIGLVVAALTFGANLGRLVDQPERYGENYDLGIGEGGDSVPEDVLEGLKKAPEVSAVTLYGATTVSVGDATVGIVGYQPVRGALLPEVIEGRLPQAGDEMALGRRLAKVVGAGVGDKLEVKGASGRRGFRVTGIAIVGGIEESDLAGRNGLVTNDGLKRIDATDGMSSVTLNLAPDAPADSARRLSERLGIEIRGRFEVPVDIVNLSRVRDVPLVIAALVGVLGILTLGHLMLVTVRRNGRDLTVLRSLGATPGWITGVVHWQATLTTAVVIAISIPLGVAAGSTLYEPYAEGVGARSDVTVPFAWIAGGMLALTAVANLVAALVAALAATRVRRATTTWVLLRE